MGLRADLGADASCTAARCCSSKAGAALSLQFHNEKDESWLVQSGARSSSSARRARRLLNEEVIGPGAAFHYRPGTVHRVTAIEDTTILEVSTPQLDDVVQARGSVRPRRHLGLR